MPKSDPVDYLQLFNLLPGAVMLVAPDDPDFTIIAENKAHAGVAMLPFNQAVGKRFLEAYPDASPAFRRTGVSKVIESLRRVIATGKEDRMEDLRYDLRSPDGRLERRYWRATHYPIFDEAGKLMYILQATTNATNEVSARRKQEEAERQLDEAMAIGLIGTWLWDLSDDYVVADKNLLRLFGIPPDQGADGLPLRTFTSAIHPEDRPRITAEIERALAGKSSYETEYRTVSGSGEIRWVIARGRVECDESGKPVRFPGAVVDVTDRKLAEQNLHFLLEASATLSSSLDYNQTLQSLTELAVPELADWCAIDMLVDGAIKQVAIAHKDPEQLAWAVKFRKSRPPHPDDPNGTPAVLRSGQPEFYPVVDEQLLEKAAADEAARRLVRKLQLTSIMVVPLKTGQRTVGTLTLVSTGHKRHYTRDDLHLAEDVANRAGLAIANADQYQRAQQELEMRTALEEQLRESRDRMEQRVKERTRKLQQTNTELNRSNQELQDFAYVASHDLQEPLRKIQAFGNLLEQEYGAKLGDGADYLKRMQGAAARMSSLITDLLAFSRVSTKAQPFVSVDLTAIAREVVDDLEARIADTGGTVRIGRLPTIGADPLQMRQLFQNLIGNALKFHREGRPPEVVIERRPAAEGGNPAYVQVVVRDNGVGFDMKYADRIFAVFQRLHGRDSFEGTGIGLAVCRKIVERHGGAITADSQPGKGSAFAVTLPVRPAGAAAPAGRQPNQKEAIPS